MKILMVFGTRPEAIKLAPVEQALRQHPQVELRVCATGQHRRLLDQGLSAFNLTPDIDLDLMQPQQTPGRLTAKILEALDPLIVEEQPDLVLVQGDTTSALAGALAARFRSVPVAHIEAGLRSGDLSSPFPEEGNRRLIDQIAVVHFAPTQTAVRALLDEGHSPDSVFLTGNTGVDAVLAMADRVQHIPLDDFPTLNTLPGEVRCAGAPLLLVTAHRRESFNGGIANICRALLQLCDRHPTLRIALPVHPNPEVHRIIRPALSQVDGVTLLPPLPYDAMVRLLMRANLLLTDSGGLQEEAPSLGLRTFVSRSCTERLEGIQAGAAVLVGTDPKTIVTKVSAALAHPESQRWTGPNPYGAGDAAVRIAEVLSHRAIARGMG